MAIEARGIAKTFGRRAALRGVDLVVARGERVGLVGANGAGKTTLLRVLAGLIEPDAGSLRVAGIDAIADPRAARGHVGLAPDAPPIHAEMALGDALAFAARLRGVARAAVASRVAAALDAADLRAHAERAFGELSFGQRRRAGLAQAIVHDPAIVLLDEPTQGLDPDQRAGLRAWIERLRGGPAIVVSSHDLGELTAVCDRILILEEGAVIAEGTLAALVDAHVVEIEIEIEARAEAAALRTALAVEELAVVALDGGWSRATVVIPTAERDVALARLAAAGIAVRSFAPRAELLASVLAGARRGRAA